MIKSNFLKNISYSLFANLVSFMVSAILVLIAPRFLGPQEYGMWQLFIFYSSFAGCCHFGWIDGIYLRYAGISFENLKQNIFSGQCYGLIILEIIIGIGIYITAEEFVVDPVRRRILKCCSIIPLLYNFNLLCNFILQITNRIKSYAGIVLVEKVVFLTGIIAVIFLGYSRYTAFYIVKVISLLAVSFTCIKTCKLLFTLEIGTLKGIINEAWENISVGSKLLIANTSSVLVIGIIRYAISEGWDVATFGKVSLTLSISNFLMIFISSVSVVLFPFLKRVPNGRLAELYIQIRDILSVILFAMLIFYYPARVVLSYWLPQYASYLRYMVILFPICVFESKVVLLINTYLKDLRQEYLMLKINVSGVLLSVVLSFFTVKVFHNLDFAVLSIVIACGFRCLISEFYVGKLLAIDLRSNILKDLALVMVFVITGYLCENFYSTLIYTVILGSVYYIDRKELLNSLQFIVHK